MTEFDAWDRTVIIITFVTFINFSAVADTVIVSRSFSFVTIIEVEIPFAIITGSYLNSFTFT